MKRLLLACSVVFAFGAMCTGAGTDEATDGEEVDKDKEVVVVPVPEDGDEEHWCCEYEDDEGAKKFALVEGPGECNDKFADMNGRWVSGNECTPCCCKSPNDPDNDSKGHSFELTTPTTCADVGECVPAEGREECESKGKEGDDEDDKDRPVRKVPVRPGSSGGAVRPGGGGTKPAPGGGGKKGKGK